MGTWPLQFLLVLACCALRPAGCLEIELNDSAIDAPPQRSIRGFQTAIAAEEQIPGGIGQLKIRGFGLAELLDAAQGKSAACEYCHAQPCQTACGDFVTVIYALPEGKCMVVKTPGHLSQVA